MQSDEDWQILIQISKGNTKSFALLFNKYQNLVYGYCMKMLKNKQKSEDITQETWLRVVKNANNYKPTASVKSWLMSITRNLVIDDFRANKKWIDLSDENWNLIEDSQADLENLFSTRQQNERLQAAFTELPENQKIILSMILIEELTQSEVAEKLNTSVGAVKASLFRARENLKKTMEDA
ncbi:sigma-70 family RNA polymerase sigma factor [bacterium]|nr:sigma-70 family RNA polymerase sigma factor [bacterium]